MEQTTSIPDQISLEEYKLSNTVQTIYYIPDFISAAEENLLLKSINTVPKPKWTQLSNRRLQNWGGIPHVKGMIPEDIPSWLQNFMSRVGKLKIFGDKEPNHVLVNEYEPGQGIMPHLDGPLFHPTISTINLGSSTVLNFYIPRNDEENSQVIDLNERKALSLFLERRSLLLLKDKVYTDYLHGIEEILQDTIDEKIVNIKQCSNISIGDVYKRSKRISLTMRHVPNTIKARIKL